jgi:hypothetical protein
VKSSKGGLQKLFLHTYLAEQKKEPSLHRGLCVIAELLKIDHNKLAHAVKGGRSIDEANSAKQKLTPAE